MIFTEKKSSLYEFFSPPSPSSVTPTTMGWVGLGLGWVDDSFTCPPGRVSVIARITSDTNFSVRYASDVTKLPSPDLFDPAVPQAIPVDMFPHTPHMELVMVFERIEPEPEVPSYAAKRAKTKAAEAAAAGGVLPEVPPGEGAKPHSSGPPSSAADQEAAKKGEACQASEQVRAREASAKASGADVKASEVVQAGEPAVRAGEGAHQSLPPPAAGQEPAKASEAGQASAEDSGTAAKDSEATQASEPAQASDPAQAADAAMDCETAKASEPVMTIEQAEAGESAEASEPATASEVTKACEGSQG